MLRKKSSGMARGAEGSERHLPGSGKLLRKN